MKDEIRIRLSIGLVAVVVIHAILLPIVFKAFDRPEPAKQTQQPWNVPVRPTPTGKAVGKIEKLQEPQHVNLQAQGEIKQQIFKRLVNRRSCTQSCSQECQQASSVVTTVAGSSISDVTVPPGSTELVARPASPPPKNGYEIALFLGSDAKSKEIRDWFNNHSQLSQLRANCDFQIYTAQNALYRTRFAEIVPQEQFPVVLFQDSTGGHVHAAGRSMIPASADELYSDLHRGFELYQQAKQAQRTGLVKSRGYSWDEEISPELTLAPEDCPDGYCPMEPDNTLAPQTNIRDRLFDRIVDRRTAFLWASAGEMATIALIVVAVVLIGFILVRRGI